MWYLLTFDKVFCYKPLGVIVWSVWKDIRSLYRGGDRAVLCCRTIASIAFSWHHRRKGELVTYIVFLKVDSQRWSILWGDQRIGCDFNVSQYAATKPHSSRGMNTRMSSRSSDRMPTIVFLNLCQSAAIDLVVRELVVYKTYWIVKKHVIFAIFVRHIHCVGPSLSSCI